jgi:heptosyltransferase-2
MKRECPIKTHECMKSIKAEDVIKAIKELNESLVSG